MNKYIKLAISVAIKSRNRRHYFLGAIGIRSDGKIVSAANIPSRGQDVNCHAETRLCRKLDIGSVVYVARTNKSGTAILNAFPCSGCLRNLRRKKVKEVYFTSVDGKIGKIMFY
jgi:tRNA(Arg) A34 adenosine deaminase TadA